MVYSSKQANLANASSMPWEESFYVLLYQSHVYDD